MIDTKTSCRAVCEATPPHADQQELADQLSRRPGRAHEMIAPRGLLTDQASSVINTVFHVALSGCLGHDEHVLANPDQALVTLKEAANQLGG